MLVRAALSEYKVNNITAIEKYGTIDTWDVSVIRDFSFLYIAVSVFPPANAHLSNPLANADLSKWNTGSAINFECASPSQRPPRFGGRHKLSPHARQLYDARRRLVQLGPQPLGRLQSDGHVVRAVVLPPHHVPLAQWHLVLRTRRVPTCGRAMFQYATSFNSDLSRWDVSKVTSMWCAQ